MLLIKSVFSGAHACTQIFNLKEEIGLFIFVFWYPTFWLQVKGLPLNGVPGFLRKLSLSILPAVSLLTSKISGSFIVTKVWSGRERERRSEVSIFQKTSG